MEEGLLPVSVYPAGRGLFYFLAIHTYLWYNNLDCGQVCIPETTEKYIESFRCFFSSSFGDTCSGKCFNKKRILCIRNLRWNLPAELCAWMLTEWQSRQMVRFLMHYGDTTVLCTATASEKPRDGIDFFPPECRVQ